MVCYMASATIRTPSSFCRVLRQSKRVSVILQPHVAATKVLSSLFAVLKASGAEKHEIIIIIIIIAMIIVIIMIVIVIMKLQFGVSCGHGVASVCRFSVLEDFNFERSRA